MRKVNNKNYNFSFGIIVINIIVFILRIIVANNFRIDINEQLKLNPIDFIFYKHFWTPITHMFAHSGFSHLFFNMFALFMFGHSIERLIGSVRFLKFYLTTGTLAGIFSLVVYIFLNINVSLVGASGAIYAVLFAYAVLFPNSKLYILGLIPINPPTLIIIYSVYDIFSHVFRDTNVAHITHLSGFLFAYLYFKFIFKVDPVHIFKNYKRFK